MKPAPFVCISGVFRVGVCTRRWMSSYVHDHAMYMWVSSRQYTHAYIRVTLPTHTPRDQNHVCTTVIYACIHTCDSPHECLVDQVQRNRLESIMKVFVQVSVIKVIIHMSNTMWFCMARTVCLFLCNRLCFIASLFSMTGYVLCVVTGYVFCVVTGYVLLAMSCVSWLAMSSVSWLAMSYWLCLLCRDWLWLKLVL